MLGVIYERERREGEGKKPPAIKKRRVPPSERALIELEKEMKEREKLRKKYEKELAKQGTDTD